MNIDSEDLREYVVNVVNAIKSSEKKIDQELGLTKDIDFELAVVHTKKVGGGIKIIIANVEGNYQNETISKIKFSIGTRLSLDDFEKLTRIQALNSKTSREQLETFKKITS